MSAVSTSRNPYASLTELCVLPSIWYPATYGPKGHYRGSAASEATAVGFFTYPFFPGRRLTESDIVAPPTAPRKDKRKNKGKGAPGENYALREERRRKRHSNAGPARPPLPRSRCPHSPPTNSPRGAKETFPPTCPSKRSTPQESLSGNISRPTPSLCSVGAGGVGLFPEGACTGARGARGWRSTPPRRAAWPWWRSETCVSG